MSKDVCVLLSTYNGGKYLKEQIDSIVNQDIDNVKLLVRDDGSEDETLDVLEKYQSAGRLRILKNNSNLGPAVSFMELLYHSPDADYYAFADQDDIWKKNKLSRAIDIIEKQRIPTLYASNQTIYKDGKEVGYRFVRDPNLTLTGILCGNHLSGCTMVLNKQLRDILIEKCNRPDEKVLRLRMHDAWVAAVAASVGEIRYDAESCILYRIHDSNTVGIDSGTVSKRISKTIQKIIKSDHRNGRSRFAKELLKISELKQDSKTILNKFADSRKRRIDILFDKEIKRDCSERRYIFILKSLLGWH